MHSETGGTSTNTNSSHDIMLIQKKSTGNFIYVYGDVNCTNIISRSDENLKENISLLENPMEKIMNINGYNYTWKKDESRQISRMKSGVIAQEVESIIPEIVYARQG